VSLGAHSAYRAVVHLEGHSYSSRRAKLFTLGAAVLQQRTVWEEWFDLLVQEDRHVLGFDCKSMTECESLKSAAELVQRNASRALQLARAAWHEVALPHLSARTGWMCYWSQLLWTMFEQGLLPEAAESPAEIASLLRSQEWVPAADLW
jgi:hypothetical protein